jgi:hypothetical protein
MAIIGAKLINPESIENALIAAFEIWAKEDINEAHWDDQFRDMSRWKYDNETKRKNGEVVNSPRDIYDLGDLYISGIKSFHTEKNNNAITAYWHWNATNQSGGEYAIYVHEGLGTNVEARPFTDDIAFAPTFFMKAPGRAFKLQVKQAMAKL